MNKNSMFFVGLDLGDKFSYITIVDQNGDMIEESRLPTTKTSFQRKFSTLQPCRVAMEVGTHSRWASHLLKDLGHDVLAANARMLQAIYHNPRKGDRADAAPCGYAARKHSPAWRASILRCSRPSTTARPRRKPTWPCCFTTSGKQEKSMIRSILPGNMNKYPKLSPLQLDLDP